MTSTERYREDISLNDFPTNYLAENWLAETTVGPNAGSISDAYGTTKMMWDWVTPKYQQLSSDGRVIVKPMNQIIEERSMSGVAPKLDRYSGSPLELASTYTYGDGQWLLTSGVNHLGLVQHLLVDLDVSQLSVLAGTSARANINPPEFQGLVFLAELRETLKFLKSPLTAWNRYLRNKQRSARRKKSRMSNAEYAKKHGRTLADYITSGWLSYRYGALPLIYDVNDAVEALTRVALTNRQTARGYAQNYGEESATQEFIGGSVSFSKDKETTRKVELRAGILYEYDYHDTFGVGIEQVPITIWEVIPFSFVADWFVNVNDYIGAITPKAGVKVLGSWTVKNDVTETKASGSSSSGTDSKWINTVASESTEVLTTTVKSRYVGTELGIATRPLPYSGDIGKKRILDTLSLTFQLLNGAIK